MSARGASGKMGRGRSGLPVATTFFIRDAPNARPAGSLAARLGVDGVSPPVFSMSVVSLFAFIFGALVGLTMAVLHFRGVKSGKALGLAHGALTVSGIVLLSSELALRNAGSAWWLVALFGVVALGGIYLFSRQVQDKPWPALVIVAHGGPGPGRDRRAGAVARRARRAGGDRRERPGRDDGEPADPGRGPGRVGRRGGGEEGRRGGGEEGRRGGGRPWKSSG